MPSGGHVAARSKAARAAQRVLEELKVRKVPVDVRSLCRKHAFVMTETLPADVAGMLVPMAPDASKPYAILVNKTHSHQRQRFTMAHELGHLLIHRFTEPHADSAPRVRFRDEKSTQGVDRDEIEANQFAAELLMPADLVVQRLRKVGFGSPSQELDENAEWLAKLAQEFNVSVHAMSVRIGNLVEELA